jgi:hypothetical protein
LAILFACEKFSQFAYGRLTTVHSDHKPLEAIFKKSLSQTTPRLQRMLLRLLKFELEVKYVPGKQMHLADTLSRAFLITAPSEAEFELAEDIDVAVHTLLSDSHISHNTLVDIKAATAADETLSQLINLIHNGFPKNISNLSTELRKFHCLSTEILEVDGVLMHDGAIIIPVALQQQMLAWLHEGHQGR